MGKKKAERKLFRLHRRGKAAAKRVNIKLYQRIEELKKDKKLMKKIDKELAGLTPEQARDYASNLAPKISEKECRKKQ